MMNQFETDYLALLKKVYTLGFDRPSRSGDTRALFGQTLEIECLKDGKFPLLTTRQIYCKPIMGELFCFINGLHKLEDFKKAGCNYWTSTAKAWEMNQSVPEEEMSLGRIYGVQWRDWGSGTDQLARLVEGLKADPFGRRHIVTAWKPDELTEMCLPPCHILFQCYIADHYVSMIVYMRSVDLCLGLPSDIVLYSALLQMISNEIGVDVGTLTFMLGDTHIYHNHFDQLKEQLIRGTTDLPMYNLPVDLDEFTPYSLEILDYNPQEGLHYALNL
jgi:thymidylate synthase